MTRTTGGGVPRLTLLLAVLGLAAACSSGGGGTAAQGLTKPADPAVAFADAYARTAVFRDISYHQAGTITTNGVVTDLTGTVSVQASPPEIETRDATADAVSNFGSGALCITSAAGLHRFQGPQGTADSVNPFGDMKAHGGAWRYLPDATMGGHTDWHLTATITYLQAPPPAPTLIYSVNTVDVFIKSQTGHIEEVKVHYVVSEAGKSGSTERRTTLSDFVYDHGVTISACS